MNNTTDILCEKTASEELTRQLNIKQTINLPVHLENCKPCPFCGSFRVVKGERYYAMCVDCGATGPERNADATVKKFTGDWNDRCNPELTQANEKIQALEKDKERLERLEKLPTFAIWQGTFADNDYNISLGRAGAPIVTLSTMDADGSEVDEEIGRGDTLRAAIDSIHPIQGIPDKPYSTQSKEPSK